MCCDVINTNTNTNIGLHAGFNLLLSFYVLSCVYLGSFEYSSDIVIGTV